MTTTRTATRKTPAATKAATRRVDSKDRYDRRTTTHALLLQAQECVNAIPLHLGDAPQEVVQAVLTAVAAVRTAQSLVKKEVKG